ncbi:MAG: TonB-dependent receptor [Bacteroidia bacterium]|nr:TonB-dependent receptor [Bacteroidia bacterium]
MKCRYVISVLLLGVMSGSLRVIAQRTDTVSVTDMEAVYIRHWRSAFRPVDTLADLHQGYLIAGKSSEVISVDQTPANIADKNVRQVMAKIPGAFVYEMDGSGNQINLSLRGLDPHRSWDLNVRQNGVLLNSDLYGYPASHYNPPLESIERIELVRGTASLQYGAMFGGMLNYVTRTPDTSRAVGFEHQNTLGSFGTLALYNSLGGRKGKLTWQVYDHRRTSEGYRDQASTRSEAQYARCTWTFSPRLHLSVESGRSTYLYQLPGPLSDAQAAADPRQATRSRNYYSPDIWVTALTLDWQPGPNTHISWISSHLQGDRSSVQFIGAADKPDTLNRLTGTYAPRQVDIDLFNSNTSELRILHHYTLAGLRSVLAAGGRFIYNDLHRRQLGAGSAGEDYDLTLVQPGWGRDLHYRTHNTAFFAENQLRITHNLILSPGIRIEYGETQMRGTIVALAPDRIPVDIPHRFVLGGISGQYRLGKKIQLLGGISQAYRPVVLGEIIPANSLEQVDPHLRDSRGYNAELGIRGRWLDQLIRLSLTAFRVQYNDRIGTQAMENAAGDLYYLKTNIGDSRTEGAELYSEIQLLRRPEASISCFTATAWMKGRYLNGQLLVGQTQVDLTGNEVESTPRWTSRNGLQASWRGLNGSVQYSYVARTYADPINTVVPNANGTRGIVPAYALWDLHVGAQVSAAVSVRASVSNLTNRYYFTKRPAIYPGPGVWPGDGRGVSVSLTVRV